MILDDKALRLFLLVVFGVAFIGFFVGTRSPGSSEGLSQYHAEPDEVRFGEPARSYGALMEEPFAANSHWLDSLDQARRTTTPALTDKVPPPDPAARSAALLARDTRRAHAGAPPVVPHAVTQSEDLACLACHQQGLAIRGRAASAMSHEKLVNCTQCHVPMEAPMASLDIPDSVSPVNSFAGLSEPPYGVRAAPGAPPTIPHQSHMRETCMSCHGPHGLSGLHTTHPERQSCTQCHAPSAELDQRHLPGLAPIGGF